MPPRALNAPIGVWFSCFTTTSTPVRTFSNGQPFCQSGARELLSRFDTGHRYIMAKSLRAAYVRPGSVVSEMKRDSAVFSNRCCGGLEEHHHETLRILRRAPGS